MSDLGDLALRQSRTESGSHDNERRQMNKYIPEILLWLFVINLGIAYGAGLYEKRIIRPQWFSKSAESGLRALQDLL